MELCVTACEKFSTNNEVCETIVKRVFSDCEKGSWKSINIINGCFLKAGKNHVVFEWLANYPNFKKFSRIHLLKNNSLTIH